MNTKINALVLGGGGREHALVCALSRSGVIGGLHCAPGGPGMTKTAEIHRLNVCDADAVSALCKEREIGLVVVGPEAPLVAGVADRLRGAGILVFGPGAAGARLEGSKAFAKDFMRRHGVPTAPFSICRVIEECESAIASRTPPFVIKADGLAAGKGVFLSDDPEDATGICSALLNGKRFGDAGRVIVIEDYLPGRELTVFAVTDGKSFILLPPSRDHKRAYDGESGPNTGGMGAYSPVALPDGLMERVTGEVLGPTLAGLASEGVDYRGVLYMGLMLSGEGDDMRISVVEYNVRFGDPEAQAVLPLLRGDFGLAVRLAAEGRLSECPPIESGGYALCVVLASGGYPGDFMKGIRITGLEYRRDLGGARVFHSGTAGDGKGNIVTNGGRVLSVVGLGETLEDARSSAYDRISNIHFNNMHYRRDIGWSELKKAR